MSKALLTTLQLSLGTVSCLYAFPALAQVTADDTVNTQVSQDGNVAEITGGETRGGNLFHSFQDFSVGTGNEAFFNNANNISNIFSRVTGGNISNIDGTIRNNGSASLFLINPAGIIFGEGASLDIGGSFYGSSASGILFEDGEFSAVNNLDQPILTVNAPIGLSFRSEPGDITVEGISSESELINPTSALRVDVGNNITLVGGNINLNGGKILAPGGRVGLGGLSASGEVDINADGSLSFADGIEKADVELTDFASVNVTAAGGGFIDVNAKNLTLSRQSELFAGIAENSGSADAQAGDITINATESIQLIGSGDSSFDTEVDDLDTAIRNHVGLPAQIGSNDFNTESPRNVELASTAQGNAGSIIVQTNRLEISDRAALTSKIYGRGNTGNIQVTANEIALDGGDFLNQVREGGIGNAGNIIVDTQSLSAQNSSFIISDIEGEGNGGNITVNAAEKFAISGENSSLNVQVGGTGKGNAGNILINTANFALEEGADIFANVIGQGQGGDVEINAKETIVLEDASEIIADTSGNGNAGNVIVNTDSQIILRDSSAIFARVKNSGEGNAGQIVINANFLSLTDNSQVRTDTDSNENAGNIEINAQNLTVRDGSQIAAGTNAEGDAGNLTVNASESIELTGQSEEQRSGLVANAIESSGSGGELTVNTGELTIEDGATITVGNFQTLDTNEPGTGEAGDIEIVANSITLNNEGEIDAATQSETGRNGANINLQVAEDIILKNNSFISAQAFNEANGGNLTVDSGLITAFSSNGNGNDIIASAEQGEGGNITINSSLLGIDRGLADIANSSNDIDASSRFNLDGNVTINNPNSNLIQGTIELSSNVIEPSETIAQACQVDRRGSGQNSLIVNGKGGVQNEPGLPLDSRSVVINETIPTSTIPQPVQTSQGKIQPARGIKVTESGEVILTAYRTSNLDDRNINNRNCQ